MKYIIIIIALFMSNFFYSHAKVNSYLADINNDKIIDYRNILQGGNHLTLDEDSLPVPTYKHISESGRFEFYYSLEGVDAIDPTDNNNNGVPDYIDSAEYYFEYVYDVFINQLGYKSPIKADLYENGDPYRIYFQELGNYYYFGEENEKELSYGGIYGYTLSNEKIIPYRKYERNFSVIMLDNNFSEDDIALSLGKKPYQAYYTFGIDALKVSIAHEFHHAVQMMYGLDYPFSRPYLEMISVLMENYVFPEVNDYIQYLNSFYKGISLESNNIESLTAETGYRHSLFMMMLEEKYSIDVVKASLEYTYEGYSNFIALDMAITDINSESSLRREWCDYKDWIYHSGLKSKNYNEAKRFKDADLFPELNFIITQEFESPAIMRSETLKSMQIRNYRVIFKKESAISEDTLDVIMTNSNPSKLFNLTESVEDVIFNVADYNVNGDMDYMDEIAIYYKMAASDHICYSVYSASGEKTTGISYAFPNPVNLNNHNQLFFPVPNGAMLYQKVQYAIYDTDMNMLKEASQDVLPYEEKRVIRIEDISWLNNGIYLFSVHFNGDIILGKFAVVRK